MLSSRIREIGFSPTLAVNDLARRLSADGVDILDFSAGQPDFDTPDPVKQAGIRAIESNRTRYTANAGVAELRQAIARRLETELGLHYDPGQILVSPGAKASLYFAFMALLEPGDEVLLPAPYWTSYPEQIRLAQGRPVFVDCPESRGFKLGAEALERAITPRTRVVLLNYPSNPTGACYDRAELEALAAVCLRHDVWVIADEIYARLIYDGREFASIAQCGAAMAGRTILIDGMSKTYSMTGWRIGYAAGPLEIISGMDKLQSHSTSNATSISQWAAVAALAMDPAELERRRLEFQARRDLMLAGLRRLDGVECVKPEGAFYLFPNVTGCLQRGGMGSSQELSKFLLEQARVAVVPGEAFGSPRHIRLSYAESRERIEEGLRRIDGALARL